MTPVDPIGPVDVRPRPVERALPSERPRRPDQRDRRRDGRDPQGDGRDPQRDRERSRGDEMPDSNGHIDVRA
jgi:hypothetical protein